MPVTLYTQQNITVENVTVLPKSPSKVAAGFNVLTSLPITFQKDVRRATQAKYFADPDAFISTQKGNLNVITPTVASATDVQRQKQSKFFAPDDYYISRQPSFNVVTLMTYGHVAQQFMTQMFIAVENISVIRKQPGTIQTLGIGPTPPPSADIMVGQDTYGWPPDAAEPPIFLKVQVSYPAVINSFPVYSPNTDVQRQRQAKYFAEPQVFPSAQKGNIILTSFLGYQPQFDVGRLKPQAKYFQEPETFLSTMPRFIGSARLNYTVYNPSIDVQRLRQARYFVDPEIYVRQAPFNELIINGKGFTAPPAIVTNRSIDVYDDLNGSFLLAWAEMLSPPAQSYNVYVNGVFYSNVLPPGPGKQWQASVTGLTIETYNAATVPPTPANGPRPQSMPPTGLITNSGTYTIKVTAVYLGVETTVSQHRVVTVNPTSIMLKTPMKRPWPFPNGSDTGYGGG